MLTNPPVSYDLLRLHPSRGLLRYCEIFSNLCLASVSSSNPALIYIICFTPELDGRPQKEEPVPMSGCDPDFGWSDGADGSGKCYMVIKNTDYTWVQQTCQRCLTMLAPRCCCYN